MSNSYWERRLRASRRKLLKGSVLGGAGVAAWSLVGCGDDDDDSGSSNGGNGTQPTNVPTGESTPSGQPRQGGVYRAPLAASPDTLEPNTQTLTTVWALSHTHSRLLRRETGPGIDPGSAKFVGDAAEGYELTDDGLKYIVRLRDDVRFHPPVDRVMTAEDVVFSYERFVGEHDTPAAPQSAELPLIVDRVEATDANSITVTVKRPYFPFVTRLADLNLWPIIPIEIGDAYNPAQVALGSGPWIFDGAVPGSIVKFKRNPNWHLGPDAPFLEAAELNVVPEYATQLSQFLGGNLDEIAPLASDVRKLQDGIDGVQFYARTLPSLSMMFFSNDPSAPWADARVRQAIAAAIDQDALLDAAFGLRDLEAAGIEFKRVWNNFIPAGMTDAWLDPKDPSVAKYFAYDPDRAKDLLAEAGYEDGFSAPFHYSLGYGQQYLNMTELIIQFLGRVGIKLNGIAEDQGAQFLPQTYRANGKFDGIAWTLQTRLADPGDYLEQMYSPGFVRNNSGVDDPELATRFASIQAEMDADKRIEMIREAQVDLAEKMYYVPMAHGAAPAVTAFQPDLRNVLDYQNFEGVYNGTVSKAWYWKDA